MINQLSISTTTRCQLRCKHCLLSGSNRLSDFPIDLLEKLLIDSISFGVRHIGLTGGEPCLYPKIEDMIRIITKLNLSWSFVSNGYSSTLYLSMMKKYREKFSSVGISLDSSKQNEHNWLRNNSFSYLNAIQSIKKYVNEGFKVWIKTCVHKENKDDLINIVNLGEKLNVHGIRFAGIIPTKWNKRILLNEEESRNVITEIQKLNNSSKLIIDSTSSLKTNGGIIICQNMGLNYFSINSRGEAIYCCDTPQKNAVLGSIGEHSISYLLKKWLQVSTNLLDERIQQISEGNMADGFDTCRFCHSYFASEN